MNFTREPIIETIITPREGYKLTVRSSKGVAQEEYSVDALEIVSFGPAIFYRSPERSNPFLVPVGDFEVVEVKEARVVLKNANLERAIKIGGGRETPPKQQPAAEIEPSVQEEGSSEHRFDKKRDRHRRRRRRGSEGREPHSTPIKPAEVGGGETTDEAQVSSPTFTTLFPPPSTLISETISRYKDQVFSEEPILPPVEEDQHLKEKDLREEENFPGSEGHLLSRSLPIDPFNA